MGAKTAFAAAVGGDPKTLLADSTPDPSAAAELIAEWLPGTWLPAEPTTLDSGIYQQGDIRAALRLPGIDILGADEVLAWFDDLPSRVAKAVGDRRLVIHQMHSVNDSMGFGVWESGRWVRMLGMDPDGGIFLNEGEPTPVERPFWAGEHAEDDDYPLPFHPLDLAEELLRAELGFVLEGEPRPDDVDAFDIPMFTFTPGAQAETRRRLFGRRR